MIPIFMVPPTCSRAGGNCIAASARGPTRHADTTRRHDTIWPSAARRDEHGTRETRVPYDRPSTLPAYAGLGAYLGELRRRAAIAG